MPGVKFEHVNSFMFLKIDKQTTDCVTYAPFHIGNLGNNIPVLDFIPMIQTSSIIILTEKCSINQH